MPDFENISCLFLMLNHSDNLHIPLSLLKKGKVRIVPSTEGRPVSPLASQGGGVCTHYEKVIYSPSPICSTAPFLG